MQMKMWIITVKADGEEAVIGVEAGSRDLALAQAKRVAKEQGCPVKGGTWSVEEVSHEEYDRRMAVESADPGVFEDMIGVPPDCPPELVAQYLGMKVVERLTPFIHMVRANIPGAGDLILSTAIAAAWAAILPTLDVDHDDALGRAIRAAHISISSRRAGVSVSESLASVTLLRKPEDC